MSFSYDVTTNRGKVRWLVQDTTDTTARPALMQDAEVDYALTTEMNVFMAAALCADVLASRFRGTASKTVGGLSIRYDQTFWEGIAKQLRARGSTHQVISAGGWNKDDRDTYFEDADIVQPEFWKGIHEDATARGPQLPTDLTEEKMA